MISHPNAYYNMDMLAPEKISKGKSLPFSRQAL